MYGLNFIVCVIFLAEVSPRISHETVGGRLGLNSSEMDPWWPFQDLPIIVGAGDGGNLRGRIYRASLDFPFLVGQV
jgi:hypothetical protein